MNNNPTAYSLAYQLNLSVFQKTKQFPKFQRPSLATPLEKATTSLAINIKRKVNGDQIILGDIINEISFFLQLAFDLKTLKPHAFEELSELLVLISQQISKKG